MILTTKRLFSVFALAAACHAAEPEFRGFWVDAYYPGFLRPSEVTNLVADVRAANCNAMIVEVRKRADAFYNSDFEPKSSKIEGDYDPLQTVLTAAHDTNSGARLEVHAWIVVYPVWSPAAGWPSHTNHLYRTHPEWLDRTSQGETFNGRDYFLDPGHPEVQKHIHNVAMDIISNYDVDGLHLDYVHYPGRMWGYNSNSVARFNHRFNRKGQPSPDEPLWMQFRRDQVTDLVRKIYLSAIELKPQIKLSVASMAWPPAPADETQWTLKSAPYRNLFQDWRGWMKEGIVDINLPLIYYVNSIADHRGFYSQWTAFAKAHRHNRHVVISPASYMNKVTDTLNQIQVARLSANGLPAADGVCLYSYANFCSDGSSRESFNSALTTARRVDGKTERYFSNPVSTPEMPWKTKPTTGHLKGFVLTTAGAGVDGVAVSLKGTEARSMTTDATGFYGAVDLPPGEYTVSVGRQNSTAQTCRITPGKVTTVDLKVQPEPSPTKTTPAR